MHPDVNLLTVSPMNQFRPAVDHVDYLRHKTHAICALLSFHPDEGQSMAGRNVGSYTIVKVLLHWKWHITILEIQLLDLMHRTTSLQIHVPSGMWSGLPFLFGGNHVCSLGPDFKLDLQQKLNAGSCIESTDKTFSLSTMPSILLHFSLHYSMAGA